METNETIHGPEAPATRPERLQTMPIDQATGISKLDLRGWKMLLHITGTVPLNQAS